MHVVASAGPANLGPPGRTVFLAHADPQAGWDGTDSAVQHLATEYCADISLVPYPLVIKPFPSQGLPGTLLCNSDRTTFRATSTVTHIPNLPS